MTTYDVMLHEWKYKDKESVKQWTGGIRASIMKYHKKVTIEELAKALTNGHTATMGLLEYTSADKRHMKETGKDIASKNRHWVKQQLFALDIDNEKNKVKVPKDKYITIDKAIRMCKKAKVIPAFAYTTYSHKEDHHRFRLVFKSNKEIDNLTTRTKIVESLFEIFAINGECMVDLNCADPSRLFYPGKELVYTDYDAAFDPDELIKRLPPTYKLEVLTTRTTKKRSLKGVPASSNKVINLLRKEKYTEIEKEVAERLASAGKPYSDWVYEGPSSPRTVTVLYITKAYCAGKAKDPLKPVFIRDSEVYYETARHFPLDKLLGVELNESMRCVLPGHDDKIASARVEKRYGTDEYIYHCYGCMGTHQYYDIFNLYEHAGGLSHAKAKEAINKLLKMEFETEWQREKKADINEYADYIEGTDFIERYPALYNELRYRNILPIFNFFLREARRTLLDKSITGLDKSVYMTGYELLHDRLEEEGFTEGIRKSSLKTKIKALADFGLIEILADEDLPVELLKEAHEKRKKKKYRYRLSFYVIPEFTVNLVSNAEAVLLENKRINKRVVSSGKQSALWAHGKEKADKLYVQDRDKGVSKKTLKFYDKYKLAAMDLIAKNGYTSEKEILSHRRVRGLKQKKELSAVVMPQLLQQFDLQVVRYTKYYKEKFDIKQGKYVYGASKIIVNVEDIPEKK